MSVDPIDLGDGWTLEPITIRDVEGAGYMICGPAAPGCRYPNDGLCGGLIRVVDCGDGKPVWTVNSLDPIDLDPSIRCSCEGQHGHVRGGRYVPC